VQHPKLAPVLVVVFFAVLVTVFYAASLFTPVFRPPYLILVLNTLFLTVTSLIVSFVSAKSYLKGASLNVLVLGGAFFINGVAACLAGWVFFYDQNLTVTIYNSCTLISVILQLLNATLVTHAQVEVSKRVLLQRLALVYLGSVAVVAAVSLVTLSGLTPAFFEEGYGATSIGYSVLATSILLFALTALALIYRKVGVDSSVRYWYASGLALFAVGLLGVSLEKDLGDPLGWVGKIAQYVGGLFFLVAVIKSHQTTLGTRLGYAAGWSEAFSSDKAQLATFFSKINEGFAYCRIITDKTGNPIDWVYLEVNDAYERINTVKASEVIGKRATLVLPDLNRDPADWVNQYGKVALTGQPLITERYAAVRDKWFHISAYSPKKGFFVSIFEDISERKKAEEAQRESAQWLATTLSSIGDAVITTNTDGRITFMNPVAEQLTGWTVTEAQGKPVNKVFHIINEVTRAAVENPVTKVLETGLVVGLANHTLLVRKDATEVPIDDSGAPIVTDDGQIRGVVLIFRDITERRKTESALERQAALIDLSPNAMIVRKMDGTIILWSNGAQRLYGWTKEEAIGNKTHDLLETKFHESFENIFTTLKTKKRWSGELLQKTKDGHEVTVQSWWLAEQTESGEIASLLETNVDITERKTAEKEIARLASFPTLNPSPVLEVGINDVVVYANPAAKNIFPTLETEGVNHIFLSNWPQIKQAFDDKRTNTFSREIKINSHWYHQQFYRVPQTQRIRIYATDIDELKKTEEAKAEANQKIEEYASQMEKLAEERAQQLKSAERLAAIGQTAGMVGHDIRNPLQAITGDMYLISEEVKALRNGDAKEAIVESIDSVNRNLLYINKIVSDLQDYTRPLRPNLQDGNLAELVEGTLVTIIAPKGIEIITDIKDNAKAIRTDVAYMRRILQNLITNAVQAMQEEGKLTIQAAKIRDKIVLSVEDTGMGIPEEVKAKMFTPLFTTKSKGQGLGLAVVRRLVDALNGTITFESTAGKGTKFIVELPQKT
jgi:PAS domain S-box-containing protein